MVRGTVPKGTSFTDTEVSPVGGRGSDPSTIYGDLVLFIWGRLDETMSGLWSFSDEEVGGTSGIPVHVPF